MREKILGALVAILLITSITLWLQAEGALDRLQREHEKHAGALVTAAAESQSRLTAVINKQHEALNERSAEVEVARIDAERATAAHSRVRVQLERLRASDRAAQSCAPPADRSETVDVLIDVLGSCISEYRKLGEEAREGRAAGLFCERSYDALIPNGP